MSGFSLLNIRKLSKAEFGLKLKRSIQAFSTEPSWLFHRDYYRFFEGLANSTLTGEAFYDHFVSEVKKSNIELTSERAKEIVRKVLWALTNNEEFKLSFLMFQNARNHFEQLCKVVLANNDSLEKLLDNMNEHLLSVTSAHDDSPAVDKSAAIMLDKSDLPEPSAPPLGALAGAGAGMEAVEELPSAPPASAMVYDDEDLQDPIDVDTEEPFSPSTNPSRTVSLVNFSAEEDPIAIDDAEVSSEPATEQEAEDPVANVEPESTDASADPAPVDSSAEIPAAIEVPAPTQEPAPVEEDPADMESAEDLEARLRQFNVPADDPTPILTMTSRRVREERTAVLG